MNGFFLLLAVADPLEEVGIWATLFAAGAISWVGGLARARLHRLDWSTAFVHAVMQGVIGLSGSMIAVLWLLSPDRPPGANCAVVGVAGLAGLMGISFWDAAIRGAFGRVLQRIVQSFEGPRDE